MNATHVTDSLTVLQSRLFAMNAGVFVCGEGVYIIDAGIFPDEIDAVVAFARAQHSNLYGQIITHSHWDHVLGPERLNNVVVIAHTLTHEHMTAQADAIEREVRRYAQAAGIARSQRFSPPRTDVKVTTTLSLPFDDDVLQVMHAPGHCSDQVVAYAPKACILWAADMLSDIEIPFIEDIEAYRQTLRQLTQLEIRALVPGHGSPTQDPREIQSRLRRDLEYLDRLERSITDAIRQGSSCNELQLLLADWTIPHPETNAREHARNIEVVYAALRPRIPKPS